MRRPWGLAPQSREPLDVMFEVVRDADGRLRREEALRRACAFCRPVHAMQALEAWLDLGIVVNEGGWLRLKQGC